MSLAKNIVKYRQKNNLSQEQLAQAMNISRQSISKWETGENLPSIDNLVSLSGLLDISLDELITGEPYLHFPFNFGKPKNRVPVFWLLFVTFLTAVALSAVFQNAVIGILIALAAYILISLFYPFDFKRYYTYWTLEHRGIRVLKNSKPVYGGFKDEILMPIKAILHIRQTDFITYKQIKSVEIKLHLNNFDMSKTFALNWYSPESMQSVREPFYFEIVTTDGRTVYLDLRQYYWKDCMERQMLSTIIAFLKRKNLQFIDQQGIAEIVADKSIDVKQQLYVEQDAKKKNAILKSK